MPDRAPSLARATVFYKDTCPPCRRLSRLIVIFSLGLVRRIPLSSSAAQSLYRAHPAHAGELALVEGRTGTVTFGASVFAVLPLVVLKESTSALASRLGLSPVTRPDRPDPPAGR